MEIKLVFDNFKEINEVKLYFKNLVDKNTTWLNSNIAWYNINPPVGEHFLDDYIREEAIKKCILDKLGFNYTVLPTYIQGILHDTLFDVYNTRDLIESEPEPVKVIKFTKSTKNKYRFLI